MVAISLYRGNLHRAPDVPRRWLMPTHTISLKDFKSLLHRRSRALSRLCSTSSSSNPNPSLNCPVESPKANGRPIGTQEAAEMSEVLKVEVTKEVKDQGGGCSAKMVDVKAESCGGSGDDGRLGDGNPQVVEKLAEETKAKVEAVNNVDELNEKEKRKRDVESKLEVLNAQKHSLVQVLKQILNAEEELKRRNSMQGMAIRPTVPLQIESTNDSGLMIRHVTPSLGSDANPVGENEAGEAGDVSNQNIQSRHVLRMSSTSPSSESPLRRPFYIQHNVVPHPSRASMGIVGSPSPSRFAPTGSQGHPGNLPTISVSGTNYVASSPSPAASGGTSVFRDARHPSPWN